jgi:hypothetical protein
MAVALSNIRYGNEDGSVTEIAFGESVKELPKDVIKDLTDQGLIGDIVGPVVDDGEKAALAARVAELEAALAEAQAPAPAAK